MKIASFNANGIRARLPIIQEWLLKEKPDVLCLQETKVSDHEFPRQPFEDLGYFLIFRGEKGYNGVALLSRTLLEGIIFGFADGDNKEESRVITARMGDIVIINTYVPQGYAPDSEKFRYKLDWLYRLYDYFVRNFTPDTPLIWAGDFNIAPDARDVYDPDKLWGSVGFHPDEHAVLAKFKKWGLVDIFREHHSSGGLYTFWDYRIANAVTRGLGWRVDHIWATRILAEKSVRAEIDPVPRLSLRPSDHTFIWVEFANNF